MRYLTFLLILAGCAGSSQMQPLNTSAQSQSVEYFDSDFDRVVDATLSAVADLGMYVENRHRAGLDQVIVVRSLTSGVAYDDLLNITIERPTAQGVAVTISRRSPNRANSTAEADSIFRAISLRLIR